MNVIACLVAESASNGQHTSPIDQEDSQQGVTLEVSNLNPETPKEDLLNFLEGLCNVDVEQIKYTEEKDIAVVTFQFSVGAWGLSFYDYISDNYIMTLWSIMLGFIPRFQYQTEPNRSRSDIGKAMMLDLSSTRLFP